MHISALGEQLRNSRFCRTATFLYLAVSLAVVTTSVQAQSLDKLFGDLVNEVQKEIGTRDNNNAQPQGATTLPPPATTTEPAVSNQLTVSGRVSRGRIGIVIQEVTKELAESFGLAKPAGVLVASVQKGSPAEKAGIEASDVILKFDGKSVVSAIDLTRIVDASKPGSKIQVQVWRKGSTKEVTVTVAEIPADEKQPLDTSSAISASCQKTGSLRENQVINLTMDKFERFYFENVRRICWIERAGAKADCKPTVNTIQIDNLGSIFRETLSKRSYYRPFFITNFPTEKFEAYLDSISKRAGGSTNEALEKSPIQLKLKIERLQPSWIGMDDCQVIASFVSFDPESTAASETEFKKVKAKTDDAATQKNAWLAKIIPAIQGRSKIPVSDLRKPIWVEGFRPFVDYLDAITAASGSEVSFDTSGNEYVVQQRIVDKFSGKVTNIKYLFVPGIEEREKKQFEFIGVKRLMINGQDMSFFEGSQVMNTLINRFPSRQPK